MESPPVFDDFDYRDYLALQGVGAVARFPALTLDAEGAGSPLLRRVYALRATLSKSLQRSLPEPASALARSLLLGQRRGLPDEVRQDFIETGTSHLLAISGLHVAILLGAALALGRMLSARRAVVQPPRHRFPWADEVAVMDDAVAAVALVVFVAGVACLLLVRLLVPRKDSEGPFPPTGAESQSLEPPQRPVYRVTRRSRWTDESRTGNWWSGGE